MVLLIPVKKTEIKVMPKPQGRIQCTVLAALQQHDRLTTAQLATLAYGHDGEFENHHVIRAIRGLIRRGYKFTNERMGRVNASGYVYVWSLT